MVLPRSKAKRLVNAIAETATSSEHGAPNPSTHESRIAKDSSRSAKSTKRRKQPAVNEPRLNPKIWKNLHCDLLERTFSHLLVKEITSLRVLSKEWNRSVMKSSSAFLLALFDASPALHCIAKPDGIGKVRFTSKYWDEPVTVDVCGFYPMIQCGREPSPWNEMQLVCFKFVRLNSCWIL